MRTIRRVPVLLAALLAILAVGGLYLRSQQTPQAWAADGQPGWRLAGASADYATVLQQGGAARPGAPGGNAVDRVDIQGQQQAPVVVYRISCPGGPAHQYRVAFSWHPGRLGELDGRWMPGPRPGLTPTCA